MSVYIPLLRRPPFIPTAPHPHLPLTSTTLPAKTRQLYAGVIPRKPSRRPTHFSKAFPSLFSPLPLASLVINLFSYEPLPGKNLGFH